MLEPRGHWLFILDQRVESLESCGKVKIGGGERNGLVRPEVVSCFYKTEIRNRFFKKIRGQFKKGWNTQGGIFEHETDSGRESLVRV